jgi:hypothetical protein
MFFSLSSFLRLFHCIRHNYILNCFLSLFPWPLREMPSAISPPIRDVVRWPRVGQVALWRDCWLRQGTLRTHHNPPTSVKRRWGSVYGQLTPCLFVPSPFIAWRKGQCIDSSLERCAKKIQGFAYVAQHPLVCPTAGDTTLSLSLRQPPRPSAFFCF